MSLMLSLYGLLHQNNTFMLQILYISGLQPFLYNRFPAVTLLDNRPLPMIFVLSENIILITNTLSAANEISTGSLVSTNQMKNKCYSFPKTAGSN